MNDQIIPRDRVREKARRAFADGKGRDDHNMNWHAAAVPVWQAEWDRCDRERADDQYVAMRAKQAVCGALA